MTFTYLFHNPANGLTKIGKTRWPMNRFKILNAKEKGILIPVCVIQGDSELQLHRKFTEFRIVGEWFRLPEIELTVFSKSEINLFVSGFAGLPVSPERMTKTVKLDDRTHTRVKKLAQKEGRIISPLVSDLVNEALNARIETSKLQPTTEQ